MDNHDNPNCSTVQKLEDSMIAAAADAEMREEVRIIGFILEQTVRINGWNPGNASAAMAIYCGFLIGQSPPILHSTLLDQFTDIMKRSYEETVKRFQEEERK